MKKTLSPYYINIPLVSPLSGETAIQYRLEIYVWDGLKTDVPALATYSKTVNNSSSSTGEHNVNISRLINDFIEFTPQDNASTALIDGNNQRWVKTQIFYQTVNESELDTPQSINLDIIVKGYTYGNEGANQSTRRWSRVRARRCDTRTTWSCPPRCSPCGTCSPPNPSSSAPSCSGSSP